jgi:hypothetical protein
MTKAKNQGNPNAPREWERDMGAQNGTQTLPREKDFVTRKAALANFRGQRTDEIGEAVSMT